MAVFRRMIARGLPRTVGEVLALPAAPLDDVGHERLAAQVEEGMTDGWRLHALGLSHADRGHWALARRRLLEALGRRNGDWPAVRLALAEVCSELSQHGEAAAHVDAAVARGGSTGSSSAMPPRRALLEAAALAHELAGNAAAAEERYLAALRLGHAGGGGGGITLASYRLVAVRLARADLAGAAEALRGVLDVRPADQAARVALGHLLRAAGRADAAAWEYEQALCIEEGPWDLPADVQRQLGQASSDGQALALLESLVRALPHCADLRLRLGNLYARAGDDPAAREQYAQALSLHPDSLDAHVALAGCELRAGRGEAAAEHARRALAVNDLHVETYAGLALARRASARRSARRHAGECLAAAGRIAGNSAVLLAQLAVLEDEDDAQRAAADAAGLGGADRDGLVRRLVERDARTLAEHPAWLDVRLRRAALLRLLGREREALAAARSAVRIEPASADAWTALALASLACGRPARAERAFRVALRPDVASLVIDYRLALAYSAELEFDCAIERLADAGDEDAERAVWRAIDDMGLMTAEAEPATVTTAAKAA